MFTLILRNLRTLFSSFSSSAAPQNSKVKEKTIQTADTFQSIIFVVIVVIRT